MALQAIFEEKRSSYRITLRSIKSPGVYKWTMYEMWPAVDTIVNQPAVLVSAYNVTHQRELELQLETAKEQLLRQALSKHQTGWYPTCKFCGRFGIPRIAEW